MRGLSVLLIGLVIGLLTAVSAQARPALCDQRPGETVAATDVARVYRDTSGREPVVRGCRHGSRKTLRLAVDGDCMDGGALGPIAAAGRYVAVTRLSCDLVSGSATVVLFDFKNLRDVLGASAFTGDVAEPDESAIGVSELAVTRAGALAWIGNVSANGVQRAELHLRRPFSATPELVASSATGDLSDVAVTAHKLYWAQDGKVQAQDL